jgi:uncharacterized membrane protein YadS
LFFTTLASFEVLPKGIEELIGDMSRYIAIIAMSAIGLMINFKTIRESASKAFKVSSIVFAMQLTLTAILILVL